MAENIVNVFDCIETAQNVGYGDCPFDPTLIKMALHVPYGTFISESDDVAKIIDLLVAPTKSARAYPVGVFESITDNSTQAGTQTFNYGKKIYTNDGTPEWSFQFLNGSMCLYQSLRKSFHRKSGYVFFIDANNVLLGYKTVDPETGAAILNPFHITQMFVPNWTAADDTKVAGYMINYTFASSKQYADDMGYAKLNVDAISTFKGLEDVNLTSTDVDDAVYAIDLKTLCSSTNVGEKYGSTLAYPAAFIAKNAATGGLITISSVTFSSTTNKYTLTLNDADTDYPTVGDPISINLTTSDNLFDDYSLRMEGKAITVLAT